MQYYLQLSYMVSEQFNPLIMDVGSGSVRVGWAGHDQPKLVESSYLAQRPDGSIDPIPLRFGGTTRRPGADRAEVVRTQEFSSDSGEWVLRPDCLQAVSDTLLFSQRGLQASPLERPLFATCPTGASAEFKKNYYEHFMESVQSPAFFLGDTSVLSMYATGRVSGVCADIGASATTVARVERGAIADFVIEPIAGDAIDQFILNRVEYLPPGPDSTESFTEQYKLALVREIKHGGCRCSHHALAPVSPSAPIARSTRGARKSPHVPATSPTGRSGSEVFKLPDGSEIEISGIQEQAAETLFIPTSEFQGLTSAVSEQLGEDGDFVLLTGGSAHFHGLHTRLVNELEAAGGQNVHVFPFAQWTHRSHSSFVGAYIQASLSSFAGLWVKPAAYSEIGIERILASQ